MRYSHHLGERFSLAGALENPAPDITNTTLSTPGFGVGLSGRFPAPWQPDQGQITFSAYAGSGIGHYITDLGTLRHPAAT